MSVTVRRLQILKDLERMGISGLEANFIELLPLVEMIWADGRAQPGELTILDLYIKRLVARLNDLSPAVTFSVRDAENFALRFLRERPTNELLSILSKLALELSGAERRDLLLQSCLDIAASSVRQYPYEPDQRFDPAEKRTFFELLAASEK